MERMEYDPEGPDYLPITEHETGSTFLVVGVIMLLAGLGWLLFVGWDIRGGNIFMQVMFAVDVLIALFLMVLGFIKKRRITS
jgi:asparagine N-glycosylation enzyme membrane subunit Stt3